MTISIALLRAINVGGNHPIAMADLRDVLVAAGCEDVTTYIQSGNVVFTHPEAATAHLAASLEQRIAAATGFDVPVVLRTADEWTAVIRDNPFSDAEPTKLLVGFLAEDPAAAAVAASEAIDPAAFAPEAFVLRGREVYLLLPNGIGRAKLTGALRPLLSAATARNWRTVLKLAELAGV